MAAEYKVLAAGGSRLDISMSYAGVGGRVCMGGLNMAIRFLALPVAYLGLQKGPTLLIKSKCSSSLMCVQ